MPPLKTTVSKHVSRLASLAKTRPELNDPSNTTAPWRAGSLHSLKSFKSVSRLASLAERIENIECILLSEASRLTNLLAGATPSQLRSLRSQVLIPGSVWGHSFTVGAQLYLVPKINQSGDAQNTSPVVVPR